MIVTTSYPKIDLTERGVQIDLREVAETGTTCDHHLAQVAPPRSTGIHCSSLIRSIAINTGKLKPRANEKNNHGSRFNLDQVIDDKDFPLVMAIGFSWEDWISRQIPNMMYHVGEFESDGISMSPDGISVPPENEFDFSLGSGIIEEFKATFKSSRKKIEDQWMWLTQVKSYCRALPTLCARIHVLHLCGDYDYKRPGMPPQYIVHSLQFTQNELDENWDMILAEKEDWKRQGKI